MYSRLHVCFLLQQWSSHSRCLSNKNGYTNRQHRLTGSNRKSLDFYVVSKAIQHLHQIGSSLTASWNGVPLSETPRDPTETGRRISPPCYDVPRNGFYPLLAGPFRTQSRSSPGLHSTNTDSALGRQRPLCYDVLRSFRPYRLDSADVFMFPGYLQPQYLTPIFKPLS
jgi:hypothetical protein